MKGKRPYTLNPIEEMLILGYEATLIENIREGRFNTEAFLNQHLSHVLEGIDKPNADEMIYGSGEGVKARFLLDCSLRSKMSTKEDYLSCGGVLDVLKGHCIDYGTVFTLSKEKPLRQIIDPELGFEQSICDYYSLAFPFMENQSVKKVAEKILDKIVAGATERYGKNIFNEEKSDEYEGKLASVQKYIKAIIVHCGQDHMNQSENGFLGFYFTPGSAALMGALYQNNIFLPVDYDDAYEKWEQATQVGVDSYLKNEIMALCATKTLRFAKDRTSQESILATIPKEERISTKDLNIHSIKRDIKELPYEYFVQGMLATTVAVFMKYLAANNYAENIRRELIKEAQTNANMSIILKSDLASLTKSVESLKKEKEELKTKLDKIQNEYGSLPKDIQTENKRLKNENNDLRKEIYILRKESENLKEEPRDDTKDELQEDNSRDLQQVATAKEEIPDWIYNKKYVFLCGRNDIATRLKTRYPNSTITETFDVMPHNASTIDAMIALTKDICHSDYGKYKQKCANLNVPFIHSSSENMGKIASDIFKSGVFAEQEKTRV